MFLKRISFAVAHIVIVVFTIEKSAFAGTVASETEVGSTTVSETISADDEIKGPDESSEKYPWDLSYTYSNLKSTDASGNAITEKSNTVNGSVGYESAKRFEIGGGYNFANTPDENLVVYGPSLYLGYTHKRVKPAARASAKQSENDDSSFAPSVGFKVTVSSNRNVETFTPNQPAKGSKVKRPTTGINEITQNSVQLESKIKPAEWVSIKPAVTFFKYNRNVTDYLNLLNSPRISVSRASFGSTVSGLADFDALLKTTFYFLDSWDLVLSEDYSIMAADQSNSWISKIEIGDTLGDWRIGLGYSNQNSTIVTDNSVILKVSYDF